MHCRAVELLCFDLEMLPVKGQERAHMWESTLEWLAVLTPGAEPVELVNEHFKCETCQKELKLECSDWPKKIRLMHVTSKGSAAEDLQLERRSVYFVRLHCSN